MQYSFSLIQCWSVHVAVSLPICYSYQIVVEKQVHPTTLHIDQMHENLNSVSKENHELNVKIEVSACSGFNGI